MKNDQLPSFQALQLNRLLIFSANSLDHEQSFIAFFDRNSQSEFPGRNFGSKDPRSCPGQEEGKPFFQDGNDGLGKFYGQAERAISTGQLRALLHFHLPPIKVVVFDRSS